jgi:DNA-binding IclR family transcriptional regulator
MRRLDMTGKKVSAEQVAVMSEFLYERTHWFDSRTIQQKTGIPGSTVRHLLFAFFKLGLLERADLFDGYRYRLSPSAQTQPYFQRVQEAAAVMRT